MAELLRGSEFPEENIDLVMLRQACAEDDLAKSKELSEKLLGDPQRDVVIRFITLQIMGRPEEAHRTISDAGLELRSLVSFLNYPYFDHNYFPQLAALLERQSISRTFVTGPPYACKQPVGT